MCLGYVCQGLTCLSLLVSISGVVNGFPRYRQIPGLLQELDIIHQAGKKVIHFHWIFKFKVFFQTCTRLTLQRFRDI